jgi:pyruvate, water dikinase
MNGKKEENPLSGLVNDAVKSMDSSEQKPVNKKTSEKDSYADKVINAGKMSEKNFEEKQKVDYIKWFSELTNKDVAVAGGKGASLGEMYSNRFPVPPGFVVTAQSFKYFIEKTGIEEKIKKKIESIELENTELLQKTSREIRDLIEEQVLPKELEEEILESYHILGSEEIEGKASQDALNILRNAQEPIFVSVRSSATTEDLAEASFAGQQESFLNVKGERKLIEHVKKCFSSLYTPRAIYYRNRQGFKEGQALLAVVVQKMVDSEKSGVIFSRDPVNLDDNIVVEAVYGLGEGIVSGKIKPDHYIISRELKIQKIDIANKKIAIVRTSSGSNSIVRLNEERSKTQVLTNSQIVESADFAVKLENHYKKPQDIEFAIEAGKIYILQSRPITTLKKERLKSDISGTPILEGLGSSPGIGVGVVKIIRDMEDLPKIKKGDVLVTEMTNPDMVVSMQKSVAIVTDEGGMTSHASIVSREMGIPCIVGTGNATSVLKEGAKITVDGNSGKIYEGEVAETKKEKIERAVELERVKLKLIVDLPDYAERAAESGIEHIGLTRIEGMIASMKKHPLWYEKENKLDEYTELLTEGLTKITSSFKSIWVRASDIRTDEYSSLEGAPEREINPMLGFHGIRFSLKHPKILEAELQAIKNIADKFPDKNIGIMFPQVISIEEVKQAKEYFNKFKKPNMEFGVMIETPAAVQIIEDICEQDVDFISFGTNDLTQFTLGVDRGEDNVQYLYNEMHPAIFSQIKRVIGSCKRHKVITSICGQAGSKKEMAEFLFKKGIDSISVNADAASEISSLLKNLEEEWKKIKESEEKEQQNKQESSEKKAEQYQTPQQSSFEENHFKRKKKKRKKKKNRNRHYQTDSQAPSMPEITTDIRPDIRNLERREEQLDKEDEKLQSEIDEDVKSLKYQENS